MNKFTFAYAFFFLISFSLFSQHIYTERSSGNLDNINYKHHLNKADYTQIINQDNYKTYIKNIESTIDENRNIQDVPLTLNLEFDSTQFSFPGIMIYDELGFMEFVFPETNTTTIDIPEGIYDLFVDFFNFSSGQRHLIVLEQQNVQENTTLTIDISDATNLVSFNTLDENGNPLNLNFNDEENQNSETSPFVFFSQCILYKEGYITHFGNFILEEPIEGEPWWNFYINDLSDRYAIINNFTVINSGEVDYVGMHETLDGINQSVILENNPDDWVFHNENFQKSAISEENVFPAYNTRLTYGNMGISELQLWNHVEIDPEEAFELYINTKYDENSANLLFSPAIVDRKEVLDPDYGEEEYFHIKGNYIVTNEDSNDILYGSGEIGRYSSYFLSNDYYLTEEGQEQILPFYSKFSFPKNLNPDIVLGDNVPILITTSTIIPGEYNLFRGKYQGRYGENRESDFFAIEIEVKQDNQSVFSGNFLDFRENDLPTNGEIEIVFTNNNTFIEELEGKNISTITYNASNEDLPPTLQHLQFRKGDNQVTHIFENADEGHIRIAAGDFEQIITDDFNLYYDYVEGSTVELSYSLHNENEWVELELTEYPEHFHMPAFGDYYEASLESVIVPAEDSWFDIKVLITDTAGNTQEQIISPAFKISESTIGIQDYDVFQFIAYPNPAKETITLTASENIEEVEVYNMVGKKLLSLNPDVETTELNLTSLASGVYLMKVKINQNIRTYKIVKE